MRTARGFCVTSGADLTGQTVRLSHIPRVAPFANANGSLWAINVTPLRVGCSKFVSKYAAFVQFLPLKGACVQYDPDSKNLNTLYIVSSFMFCVIFRSQIKLDFEHPTLQGFGLLMFCAFFAKTILHRMPPQKRRFSAAEWVKCR